MMVDWCFSRGLVGPVALALGFPLLGAVEYGSPVITALPVQYPLAKIVGLKFLPTQVLSWRPRL